VSARFDAEIRPLKQAVDAGFGLAGATLFATTPSKGIACARLDLVRCTPNSLHLRVFHGLKKLEVLLADLAQYFRKKR